MNKLPRDLKNGHRSLALVFVCIIIVAIGCKLMPGWKELSESETKRRERIAEEKIQESESFRSLNDRCTNRIPIYETFVYKSKSASWKGSDFLSIFYRSPEASGVEWNKVKAFYKTYFAKEGWKITDEADASWGSSRLDHQNGKFLVRIYFKGLGDADYGFHCANLPELDENGKPRR